MKNFATPSFRLSDAPLEIRLVYSFFLVFVLGGLVTTWIFEFQRIGFGYERVVSYYLGGETSSRISFAKSFGVLLEETHFHTFMMGVTFLVLAHLFVATSASRRWKLFVILLTFLSSLLDVAGVWLVRYLSPTWAYLMMAGWTGMTAGYLAMILVPLHDMWLGGQSV